MPIQIQMDTTLKQDSGPQKKISAELFLYIHPSQINYIFRKSIIQLFSLPEKNHQHLTIDSVHIV